MSDEDLEKVAGGVDIVTGMVILSVVAVVAVSAAAANSTTKANHGW